ncbi:hypothetical protein CHLRE_08g367150v5 [Chlamydomonas reinhardtii]|uniref:Major facilitator superfamily (MFS) profile domain-containing protein n=1 Tax=Chlamydomonas reinhardtii TaxID=3055 RepID=A8J425_CHLRE|nr:uncharacterized protein CHLRE_08g367150v5 [Chlamydomonas reinhardtii]PNW79800.1 hypothetical protein CHLRE_08g367150v5 [Chlamydomonas reinhardtii]|eukprot:XP_001696136.1 predicted protein [Chlamydomonas reinhardtii]
MGSGARWDAAVLFLTRTVRMLAYGSTGVVLALFLSAVGLSDREIGSLLTLTLLGDSAISLWVTRHADGLGRRACLAASCLLMVLAGAVYGTVQHPSFALLLVAATVGVLSPSGNEVGPFMALEQAVLSELVPAAARTHVFAWYNLVGYAMTAIGALVAGHALTWAQAAYGITAVQGYRFIFLQYAASGAVLLLMFLLLTNKVERKAKLPAPAPAPALQTRGDDEEAGLRAPLLPAAADEDAPAAAAAAAAHPAAAAAAPSEPAAAPAAAPPVHPPPQAQPAQPSSSGHSHHHQQQQQQQQPDPQQQRRGFLGLTPPTRSLVLRLSALFSLDSLAGGLVTGTLLVYFFQTKYGVSTAYLGGLLFGANMLAAVSALASGFVAARLGLINTMVFTHLPSNVLMLLVPLMPSLESATAMVFARYSISQMDVAPRSAYVAGVVPADERSVAMGVINIAKSLGAAFGPLITGWLAQQGLFAWAFYLCGGGKIVYDLLLYFLFSHIHPQH